MEFRHLHDTIGVEVVRPAKSMAEIDELRRALDECHLLFVRVGMFTPEAQLAFVARFGPVVPERNIWGYVSNVRDDSIVQEGALLFHSDFAFTASPVLAISLHALEMPADGSPTLFANAVRAVGALPADLRARVEDRRVLNLYDFTLPNDRPMRVADADPRSPRHEHPVIGRHPRTGAEVVMANEMHTDCIVGIPAADSDALLRDLFAVLYDQSNVYEHRWAVGDLMLWDNIALHHGRRDIPRDEPRTLRRLTLGFYTPGELVPNLEELLGARRPGPT
jgi:taurine dioxygenase